MSAYERVNLRTALLGSRAWSAVDAVASSVALVARLARIAATRPVNWGGELAAEMSRSITRVTMPLALSVTAFAVGAGSIIVLPTLEQIGGEDRYGLGAIAVGLREFNGWITGMCVAGIAGTAICADLGSRKIRDELDALTVLGVDPTRSLVLPRVLALTLMTPMLFLWATAVSTLASGVSGELVAGYGWATYTYSIAQYHAGDLIAACVKMAITGFVVGVVCCLKGINVKGGPAGVGRAVNQAVVVAFAATWILNYLFNTIFLALFPHIGELR